MASQNYDAIVIGSGITGGWAAKELSEKGLRTLVLEAGRPINPDTDYVEHVPAWEKRFRGMGDRWRETETQVVQQKCSAFDEWCGKFFVNDKENPYTTDPDKPFLWIRGRQVGGRSIMWGRQSYRWSDLDFEANQREGIAIDWPIRYKDIAPWYDYVEDFIGVSGQPEGLPQSRRKVFAAHGNDLRRVSRQRCDCQTIRGRAPDDHWPSCHSDAPPSRTCAMSLLRALSTRLHYTVIFQQPELYPTRGTCFGEGHSPALQCGPQPDLRFQDPQSVRRPRR